MRRDWIDFRLHDPTGTAHKTTLQGVIHQLDVALEDPQTQRSGLVFIYNMYGSKYSNFDYDLSQKMLTMLKGCYPARLKKVLIVTAPVSKLPCPQSCYSIFFVPCSCSSQGQLSKTIEQFSALFCLFILVPETELKSWNYLLFFSCGSRHLSKCSAYLSGRNFVIASTLSPYHSWWENLTFNLV